MMSQSDSRTERVIALRAASNSTGVPVEFGSSKIRVNSDVPRTGDLVKRVVGGHTHLILIRQHNLKAAVR